MKENSYVVCVGASAGGLEAIEALFRHLPDETGAAFVVIQHLSPDHKSMMVDILSKWTRMAVVQIEDGMQVEANHVYLIPPNRNVRIFNGKLLLMEKEEQRTPNLPIDIFMASLAEDYGKRAIGIVLSGTGSDGTHGLRMIKENLGLTMAQDEFSAAFDGMPRSAVASGAVDLVLAPEAMPDRVVSYMRHPLAIGDGDVVKGAENALSRIFALIRERHNLDFSMYKPNTILRRMERRMQICHCSNLDGYYRYLRDHPSEVELLHNELLIGVTSFFRDHEVFTVLQDRTIPDLIEALPQDKAEVRVWCAACSSGEEPYTLAIAFLEAIKASGRALKLKLFATDVDEKAIVRASQGEFPEGISQSIPEHLLNKYFHYNEKGYKVSNHLREPIVFAQHNLLKDPPFTNIDMISCRNLLIYLLAPVQKRVIRNFNFSLRPGGILLLGTSESLGDSDLFETLNSSLKIFRSKGIKRLGESMMSMPHRSAHALPDGNYSSSFEGREHGYSRLLERYIEVLAESLVECAVLVGESLDILHAAGKTEKYLTFPKGRVKNDLTKVIHKDLSVPLLTAINRLRKRGTGSVTSDVRSDIADGAESVRLTVRIIEARPGLGTLFCVWMEKHGARSKDSVEVYSPDDAMHQRISDLEQSLLLSQETLQATVEELETSNEELQATNEELLASNEELQSTNEELQSVNEELYTVNSEYQDKIQELTEAVNDLDNFIKNIDVAVIYLDEELEIRRFTEDASRLFNLRDIDIGRPFAELSHQLVDIDLNPAVMAANLQHKTTRKAVCDTTRVRYMVKCSPYNIAPGIFSGVVISLMRDDYLERSDD